MRLPIRVRVTLAFTGAMAVLLAGLGAFLYLELGDRLQETLDAGLETRVGELSSRVSAGAPTALARSGGLGDEDESFAQVLTPGGRVRDGSSFLGDVPAIGTEELTAAAAEPAFADVSPAGFDGPARVLAAPVTTPEGTKLVVLAGASADDRDEALAELRALLLVGGPSALLLAALAGFAAISAALRPVEAMRARADEVRADDRAALLPVPAGDDELTRLAETLNAMLDRLREGIERERRFVDDASHELRTPLAMHRAALELALRYDEGEPAMRAALASALEDVDRLIGLAEDLLVVARAEQGRLELRMERVAAGEVLQAIRRRFAQRASEEGRRLEAEAGPGIAVVCDRDRVEQALANLVDNALRHGDGPITLAAEPGDGVVRLHVRDAGAGFPPEFAPRAFDRFSRADEARADGGSGLGLAIVAMIAAAHRGTAGIASGSDGADVWIELPAEGPGDAVTSLSSAPVMVEESMVRGGVRGPEGS